LRQPVRPARRAFRTDWTFGATNCADFAASAGAPGRETGSNATLQEKKITTSGIYRAQRAAVNLREVVKEWPPSHRNCGICITIIHKLGPILPYPLTKSRECWY